MLTYGEYGGRYVPETLIPALDELEAGWRAAPRTTELPAPSCTSSAALRGPADAAHARRALRPGQAALPEARGPAPHRRAQAQQRARPGAARAAARQAADRRRDRRRPARRRDRDRLRALRPRLRRLHGQRGHAPAAAERRADGAARRRGAPGRVRHADAEGGDERGDPRLDHERRGHALPDRLVRRPGAVPGDRARAPVGDRPRGARADARGRGPAAGGRGRVRRRRLERDRALRRLPRRRRGAAGRRRGRRRGEPRLGPAGGAARLALVGARRRGRPGARRAVDLGRARLPGRRPGARVPPRQRPGRVRRRDRRGGARRLPTARPDRRHHPRARAVARARARRDDLDEELVLVCLSGRGDKDLAEVLAR